MPIPKTIAVATISPPPPLDGELLLAPEHDGRDALEVDRRTPCATAGDGGFFSGDGGDGAYGGRAERGG